MTKSIYILFFRTAIVTAMLVAMVCSVSAIGSFQATLDWPSSFISHYDKTTDEFSVAIGAPIIAEVIGVRRKNPKFIRSSFFDNSLTFNTEYYRRGISTQDLIPVSTDAMQYMQYRIARSELENARKLVSRSLSDPNSSGGRRGLGINVALPKRLDRIFGEGGAGLTVSGYNRVTFSGRSQWTDAAKTDVYAPSKFPSLRMEQISRFDITGTIGSKISVKVSQDSQNDIPLANRIQIRYKGDEDDILKTIEAGNTNLNLPNTQFVGYSSRIRGLFGIKSEAQIGNLGLTVIASQEKGSSERATFSPTGEEAADDLRDWEYARDRIFDLGLEGEFGANDIITTLFLYEEERSDEELEAYDALIVVNPDDTSAYPSERIKGIRVKQMDATRYEFFNDTQAGLHYLVFTGGSVYGRAVAAYMVVKRGNGDIDTLGNITQEPYTLKLIRHTTPQKDYQTWNLMWRNCYAISRGASIEDLDVKVFKGLTGAEKTTNVFDYQETSSSSQSYLEILGLDRYNSTDQKIPDGKMDDRVEVFRPEWGLLIFPEREPFNSNSYFIDELGRTTDTLTLKVPQIYDFNSVTEQTDASQYFIRLATRSLSSVISLNRPNIIEGSERITVNGKPLVRDKDYKIQYDFGRVTLMSPDATDPNADIAIDYEYAPFLAIQKKTLLGARAEYEWSKDFQIGGTILYKSDKAQERKPRVGQETATMVVYDLDASLKLKPNFLTTIVDKLPLVKTQAQSGLTISGEIAQSHPNPNVDGVAYIDDFESALEQLSLGVSRTTWQPSSIPAHIDPDGYVQGKMLWHQPRDAVLTQDVYDLETGRNEGSIRTMRMIFRPEHYDISVGLNADSTGLEVDTAAGVYHSWGGLTRYFNSRVDAKRVQLFEFRMRGSKRGQLHFDFGRISEDANDNGNIDSEDIVYRNGSVEEEEDTGLDNFMDADEPGYLAGVNVDPSGDNWYFLGEGKCPLPSAECNNINWDDESIRYEWLNGTEGNIGDISVLGRPDKEQLNSSGFNEANAYFSYMIDLADDAQFLVEGSEKGDADNPWRTYRIPIHDSLAIDTIVEAENIEPNWANISHVRVWFEDRSSDNTPDTVEIAAWYFVQSNWRDSLDVDTLRNRNTPEDLRSQFVVASISEEDGTFSAPPGVEAYKDPNTGLTEPQRGLELAFENLSHFDTCMAIKELMQVDKYSGYRHMEMWVHGGNGIILNPNGQQDVGLFMRIGQDSVNFYEIRTDVRPGWDGRNHIDIDFNELTAFKDSLIREVEDGQERFIDGASEKFRVKGSPNLNEIKYFVVGIVNHNIADTVGGVSGSVWLDELRVTDVRRDVGTAARISINGNLADLFNYRFGYSTQDPYFRKISSATRGGGDNNLGSGKTATSYNYNLTLKVDRFMPKAWGANLPVSYSYSKSTTIPLLKTSSDIILPDEIRDLEKSVSENRNFTISERFNHRGSNPLFSILLNRQSVSMSYRRSQSSSVTTPYSFGENVTVKTSFDMNIKKMPTLPIFFWTKYIPIARKASKSRLGLYPTNWTFGADYSRNASISDTKNGDRRSSVKRDFTGRMDFSYKIFDNLSFMLKLTTHRDMSDLTRVNIAFNDLRMGLETNYSQAFNAKYNPQLFSWFGTQFDYKANYSDDYDRSAEARNGKLTRSWSVNGTFDHTKLLGGKSSGSDRRYSGRRSSRRGGGAKKETVSKPFYDPPLAVLRFLTGWVKAPTYSYSESFSSSLPGMLERPAWRHRFGLDQYADVDTVQSSRPPTASESINYKLGSGFSFLGGLTVDVKFSQSVSSDLITRGSRYEKISTSWPDLTIRIQKFKTLPLIKGVVNKVIEVFSPRTGYSRSSRETVDLDIGHTTSKSTTTNRNPLISVNFKLFRKLTLSVKYNLSNDENKTFNSATGALSKLTRGEKTTLDFQTGYSFASGSGFGLPFLGKIKFKSSMSLQLNVKINSSLSETSTDGGPFVIQTKKSDFSWSTTMKYSFSQQVNGGMTMRWQDSNDETRNRRSHVRELSIWAELRF